MTDYEKAILFSEFLNTANFVFSNYMALVFAMLAASFFLAHRMKRWIALLFLALYSMAAVMAGSGVVFAFSDFASLGSFIHETATPGGELRWLAPAGPGGAGMKNLPYFVILMVFTAYIGSVAFFFIARKKKLADG